jgi:tRNA nucleotidyltransferase (CCA-adding enzyme)
MEVYLVGGAIRDAALGLPVRERDWVVVGATPDELERAGFIAVGRDFPVFLHPETREEHALARTERKTGPGYRGFVTTFSPDVTLADDLVRRDLTVNAMARAADGTLIDPYGGMRDLEARVLRHVSPAFVEDPVRILRVARFAARFHAQGFSLAPETLALTRTMVANGEAAALVPERVWQETVRALETANPEEFFNTLRACGALAVVFPEIDALFGVPQPPEWHPEIDTGVHTLLSLRAAVDLGGNATVRFAALVHDLGKALTPRAEWPRHRGHETAGLAPIDALCERLRVPAAFRDLARLGSRFHLHAHRAFELRAATILGMLDAADAWRRPERFAELLLVCEADARGRTGRERDPYPQAAYLRRCQQAAAAVALSDAERAGLDGRAIGERVRRARLAAIDAVKAAEPAAAGRATAGA